MAWRRLVEEEAVKAFEVKKPWVKCMENIGKRRHKAIVTIIRYGVIVANCCAMQSFLARYGVGST